MQHTYEFNFTLMQAQKWQRLYAVVADRNHTVRVCLPEECDFIIEPVWQLQSELDLALKTGSEQLLNRDLRVLITIEGTAVSHTFEAISSHYLAN